MRAQAHVIGKPERLGASHASNQVSAAPAAPTGASTRLTPGFLPALMSGGSVELTMYTPGAWWLKGDISWAFFLAYFRLIFGFLRYGRSYACFLGCPPVFTKPGVCRSEAPHIICVYVRNRHAATVYRSKRRQTRGGASGARSPLLIAARSGGVGARGV